MTATILDIHGLECPCCHGALESGDPERLRCAACNSEYQVVDGVPGFCETQSFYEDYLEQHCPFCAKPPTVEGRDPAGLALLVMAGVEVLQEASFSVNIIETDSQHPFAQLGKSDPELYRVNFVETDGHVGLEAPSQVLARFERHGFEIEQANKMESRHIHLRYYEKYLSKGFPERVPKVRRRIERWRRILGNPAALAGYEVFTGAYHRLVESCRSRLDDSMFIAVSARKLGRDVASSS